jgi:hypothetical protein
LCSEYYDFYYNSKGVTQCIGKAAQTPGLTTWRTGLFQCKCRQPKCQVSLCRGMGLAHAQGKDKPTLAPRGARVWPSARVGQPTRHVSSRGGAGLADTHGSPTKTWSDHFLLNHPFNVKCIPVKRQLHPSPAALATLCGKG